VSTEPRIRINDHELSEDQASVLRIGFQIFNELMEKHPPAYQPALTAKYRAISRQLIAMMEE